MKEYSSDKIRNVAVVSHDGAGKTALVESLLLTSGAVDFVGKGQDNKHIMDFEPEEIKRNVIGYLGSEILVQRFNRKLVFTVSIGVGKLIVSSAFDRYVCIARDRGKLKLFMLFVNG